MPTQSKGREGHIRLRLLLVLTIVSAIGALSCALFLFAEWNELALQDAIERDQVTAQIHGIAEDGRFSEPMVEVTLDKKSAFPLTVVIPQGVTLQNPSGTADVVIAQTEKITLLGSSSSHQILAYTLDYTKGFPNSTSKYEVTSTINEDLKPVLNNIVGLKAEHEIASQLAVWKSDHNVELEVIAAALPLDVSQYAGRVDEIVQANYPPPADSWLWEASLMLFVTLTFVFAMLIRKSRQHKRVIDQLTDWQLLANGGMAQVWVAHHERFQQVVVKFPQTHEDKLYQQIVKYRFEIEIEEHQKLHHPNIVPLIEHGDATHPHSKQTTCYLIQQFVDGCTLDELLSQQPHRQLPETIIFEIVAQLLAALAYIHQKEVIHRDLTLKNIMVEKTGQVYLIDFGNSTSIGSQNTEIRGLLNVGTAPFYAPSEIGNVPERDFYALAMVIYAMYGGSLTTAEDTNQVNKSQETLRAIEQELEHLTNVPKWLHVVLKKCWNGQYQDSATLRSALRLSPLNQIVTEIRGEDSRVRHNRPQVKKTTTKKGEHSVSSA
ncbi:MAG: serine/threonine-protein kinase [Ardenticatenaceae bacterium]